MLLLGWLLILAYISTVLCNNPHFPHKWTWVIQNSETGHNIVLATQEGPQIWFPDLEFDLCQLAEGSWKQTKQKGSDTPIHYMRKRYLSSDVSNGPPYKMDTWYIWESPAPQNVGVLQILLQAMGMCD